MVAFLATLLVVVIGLGILYMILKALPPAMQPSETILRIIMAIIGLAVLIYVLQYFGVFGRGPFP